LLLDPLLLNVANFVDGSQELCGHLPAGILNAQALVLDTDQREKQFLPRFFRQRFGRLQFSVFPSVVTSDGSAHTGDPDFQPIASASLPCLFTATRTDLVK
jgi:hypothetical protein